MTTLVEISSPQCLRKVTVCDVSADILLYPQDVQHNFSVACLARYPLQPPVTPRSCQLHEKSRSDIKVDDSPFHILVISGAAALVTARGSRSREESSIFCRHRGSSSGGDTTNPGPEAQAGGGGGNGRRRR